MIDPSLPLAPPSKLRDWWRSLRRRWLVAVRAAIAVLIVAAAVLVAVAPRSEPDRTISATFAEAPGLYPGNRVDVLDVPVGTVTSVRAEGSQVIVGMRVPMRVPIPSGASAVLEAPEVVNDRYIQLQPAWSGGPVMGRRARIPLSRTAEPLTTDQILSSLDTLLKALGPVAHDSSGVLSSLISTLDRQLGGQGPALHGAIASTSLAVQTLADNAPQLVQTLQHLGSFLKSAASDASTYAQLTENLAGASADLSSDRDALGQALAQLATTLRDVTTFVQANASNLKGSLTGLAQATAAVAANQRALAQTIQVLPLFMQNTQMAVHGDGGKPSIQGRVQLPTTATNIIRELCGNTPTQSARALRIFTEQSSAPPFDLLCIFGGALASYKSPPGSPTTPDVSLQNVWAYKNQ